MHYASLVPTNEFRAVIENVVMAALYVMIPVAMIIVALAIKLFFWAVDNGQYEDLDSPAHSILFDDEDPLALRLAYEEWRKLASKNSFVIRLDQ